MKPQAPKALDSRPFHESLVDTILRASSAELELLATLIKSTKIPRNHDKIIAAWNQRRKELRWGNVDLGVPASLHEQQEAAAKKAEGGEKQTINLDDLQQELKMTLALLKDRCPGLVSWNEFLRERLTNLHRLTSQALGK